MVSTGVVATCASAVFGFVGGGIKMIFNRFRKVEDDIVSLDKRVDKIEGRVDNLEVGQHELTVKVDTMSLMLSRLEAKVDLLVSHFIKD